MTVTLGGIEYGGELNEDGSWSVNIPPTAFVGLGQGQQEVTVKMTDRNGNPIEKNGSFIVDTSQLLVDFYDVETTSSTRSVNFMVDDDEPNNADSATHKIVNDMHNARAMNNEQDIVDKSTHNILLAKLLNADDTSRGHEIANNVASDSSANTARSVPIDLRELLQDRGDTATTKIIDREAAQDKTKSNMSDDSKVVVKSHNTDIQIDRDDSGSDYYPTTLLPLNSVQTDLATLLANQQLLVV